MRRIDLKGQIFDRLTVIELGPKQGRLRSWRCACVCGNEVFVPGGALRSGNTRSCGCLQGDLLRTRLRKPKGHSGARNAYASCRNGAGARGHAFDLEFSDFVRLTSLPCNYCGLGFSKIAHIDTRNQESLEHSAYKCNGLDRVDNERGYVLDKVVPCCSQCNYAKRNLSHTDFLALVVRIYRHQNASQS